MAIKNKALLGLSLLLLVANCMQYCVNGKQQVPCFFVLGDSLNDNGNNNHLPTAAKVNYNPYGIDFPTGPTGRFCNGKIAVDYYAEYLEFKESVPPYANISGADILKGVNFASGAAGILFESGKQLGANIHLGEQVKNYEVIYSRIVKKLGSSKKAKEYLNKCLYYVNIGSNDYINNFFLYPTSRIYTLERFTDLLIKRLSDNIKELHEKGARKVVFAGLGRLGSTPNAITRRGNGNVVREFNDAADLFNKKLVSELNTLNNELTDFKFTFINSTRILDRFVFSLALGPCCPTRDDGQCIPNGTPCPNRNEYQFYDELHITELVHRRFAMASFPQIKALVQR